MTFAGDMPGEEAARDEESTRSEPPSPGEEPAAPEEPAPGGGLVRPFIITGGRTATSRPELRWEALVEATGPAPAGRSSEQAAILAAAATPVSVAELSALLQLPTAVVAIVVEDLLDAEAVCVHQTDPVEIELSALTRMIERVRSL